MPRPWGGSPISCLVGSSMPVVMKRSRFVRVRSMTPSAAYRAPVSSAAVSTSFCSSASRESSELSAMPASTSPRSRSRVASCSVAMPKYRLRSGREQSPEHERQDAAVAQVLALAWRVEAEAGAEFLLVRAHRHLARLPVLDSGDRELLAAAEAERRRSLALHA